MPRFPVNFRRKSQVTEEQNGPVEPSFRVLERSDTAPGKSFDGGVRMMKASGGTPRTTLHDITTEDNLFVDMKNNRGSSNVTKAPSDNSSRHSNASTAPSSTDHAAQEEWRNSTRKPVVDVPPPPKSSGGNFLKNAGRTFSFGGTKKNGLATIPSEEPVPAMPERFEPQTPGRRSRAPTSSSVTTATPPQLHEQDFKLDLGGDLSNMLSAFNKRSSVMTLKAEPEKSAPASRNLTGGRSNHPSPLHLDNATAVEPPPKSWNSQRSDEGLLGRNRAVASPPMMGVDMPPPVPRHTVSPVLRRKTPEEDEDANLLKDSAAATRFLSSASPPIGNVSTRGYRRDQDTVTSLKESYAKPSRFEHKPDEENMFETSFSRPKQVNRPNNNRGNGSAQNKVMTPAEFEKYRLDKVRQSQSSPDRDDSDNEEEENYDDDEDEREKTLELAKQRRKQEAHMTVYRQQMMKVTGENSGNAGPSRPSLGMSMSTPNLLAGNGQLPGTSPSPPSDESEDEEVPLAILAAHGFPGRNRPPTRLTNMASNPNLRGLNQPSYVAGPGSTSGDGQRNSNGPLPAFARKLPQDPFLGAGLVNQPPRETFSLAGGAPPTSQNRSMPVGGLVGVIANEEKARAMRRGSPAVDHANNGMPPHMQMPVNQFDPMAQIPPQMMYGQQPMPTSGDQAQAQMNQQMQQFMQMQMQFMQMMTGQNQLPPQMQMQMPGQDARPVSHMDMRQSFLGDPMTMGMGNGMGLEPPRGANQARTMSMVQPSSSSWIQPMQGGYGAPSIRLPPGGYTPSIAPSERSNIGLPGRYRPVSSLTPLDGAGSRSNTMSGALPTLSKLQPQVKTSPLVNDDDDEEEGWAAMKAKREKKKSSWRTKKAFGSEIGALIS